MTNKLTKEEVNIRRNEIKRCPCCNGNIEDRDVQLSSSLIKALYNVCRWCKQHDRWEFEMRDIKDLLGKTQYATFGDLVRFGGIVYKKGKASYGINKERAVSFFKGESTIKLYVTLNQITGEVVSFREGKITDVKSLKEWLNKENGLYMHKHNPYREKAV